MARAIAKIGEYRLYKVEGKFLSSYYEIYNGTKTNGVHVENIANKENFEWAVGEIRSATAQALKEEFGIEVSN